MNYRKLGKSGHKVSVLGLSRMGVSYDYGTAAVRRELIEQVRQAVERVVTFFETAETYSPFTNEELVAEALAPYCKKVTIATKFRFNFINWKEAGLSSHPNQELRDHLSG